MRQSWLDLYAVPALRNLEIRSTKFVLDAALVLNCSKPGGGSEHDGGDGGVTWYPKSECDQHAYASAALEIPFFMSAGLQFTNPESFKQSEGEVSARKRFVYLVQHFECMNLSHLRTARSEASIMACISICLR
jgi:hypothetical protein